MAVRSVVLFSGGLDSALAAAVLLRNSVEVIGMNFVTPFYDSSLLAQEQAASLGIELVVYRTGDDYIQLIANPQWGYGKGANPCVDCRIAMCRAAGEIMRNKNADFVATGEIAGQRPNSQMQHQLSLIARESGLNGFLVRPLSASVLEPSEAEKRGLIDRTKLYGYTGRGRGHLVVLAKKLGIKKIPQPSTGCFLCEKSYAPKIFDLFKYESNPTDWDAQILNAGRQIRINENIKAVVARNETQCEKLKQLFNKNNTRTTALFIPETFNATTIMLINKNPFNINQKSVNQNSINQNNINGIDDQIIKLGEALIIKFTPSHKINTVDRTIRIKIKSNNNTTEFLYNNSEDINNILNKDFSWQLIVG
ncbi:MAG: hypothetical protein LBQ66_01540 [Planctomycetaceae bacterium]|nr:hypothetical protein [Planctomycetaceae bacterium]